MTSLLRILVGIVAVFNLALGLIFLLVPLRIAPTFNVVPEGVPGIATLRADFSAFFLCGGLFALIGAWRAQRAPLRVPLLLLGIALAGRSIGVAIDGMVPATVTPMAAELAMIVILALAYRQFAAGERAG